MATADTSSAKCRWFNGSGCGSPQWGNTGGRGGCFTREGMCRPTALFHPCHKHTYEHTNTVHSQSGPPIRNHRSFLRVLHSPVSVLVKGLCRWESQRSADDAAAAEVPAVAADVTPLPAVLHLQHSLRHQAAVVASEDRPETRLFQLD